MTDKLELESAGLCGMTLAYHAQERPTTLAVATKYGERSFDELNNRANQFVRVLRKAGLKTDDGVAMLLVNRPEFVEIYYACLRGGFRITPINWHLSGDNASYIVANSEAKAFIGDIKCVDSAIDAQDANHSQLLISLSVGGEIEGFESYTKSISEQDGSNITDPSIGTSMLYTSGTTGRPKGVYRDRVPPDAGANQTVTRVETTACFDPENDFTLCTGPAYHAAPLAFNIVSPLSRGTGIVMMDKWDAEETLRFIEKYRVTHTHMVATMFHRLLALPEEIKNKYDLSSLRYILHGAAPCPVHVKQSMMDWLGPIIFEYYAATEGGGGFFIEPEEWLIKPGSVGKAPESADNKICDDDGNGLGVDEIGTIYFRAPATRFRYYKDTSKTNDSYSGDYFTLGDMGYFDADGYLFLTGRSAETIISGGVNIYPQETDDVLLKHDAVADVCTVGIPSEEWGEEVKSVVQLKEGLSESDDLTKELIDFVRSHLAVFKAPRTIDFVDELPRLPSGKIQRKVVRAPYWAGRDKQI
ncbi:MAG: long-chain acyl-CoA synthetase [Candidatus Azotimanducaceae bacterium]|jgi:long-chain acyl-CoA synthetase